MLFSGIFSSNLICSFFVQHICCIWNLFWENKNWAAQHHIDNIFEGKEFLFSWINRRNTLGWFFYSGILKLVNEFYDEAKMHNEDMVLKSWFLVIFSSLDCIYPLLTEDIEWFTFVSFLQYDHVVGISTGSLYCLYVLGVSKQWVFYALQGLLPFPLFALAFRCWCVMWLYVNFWVSYTKIMGVPCHALSFNFFSYWQDMRMPWL